MSVKTRLFVAAVTLLGIIQLADAVLRWNTFDEGRFLLYLLLAVISSVFRLKRLGNGISLSLPFVLLSILELSTAEAVVIGCTSVLVHSLRSADMRANLRRIAVAVAIQATVIATGGFVLNSLLPPALTNSAIRALVGAFCLFVANTLPVAIAVRLSSAQRLGKVWKKSYSWVLPYYLVCGALAVLIERGGDAISADVALLVLPNIYLAYRYYRNHRAELEVQREHANQTAALHIRAIEGLALAVEAKDGLNIRGHLRRVQTYSLAIGKEMGLSGSELDALQAGALLHDIGKLAIPDYILTKPGKLTAEEFARMKVHPVVGAEIVDQVQFPYPVAPIVKAHHEKWNGSGSPYGLKGNEIPVGARILTVVDCLDAMTSDREYRRATSLEEAMRYIVAESGKSFDPEVVQVLGRLHQNLAREASAEVQPGTVLSIQANIVHGAAPAAGLDLCGSSAVASDVPAFLSAIAAAHNQEKLLRSVADSVSVLEMEELLPQIQQLLEGLIPYDALAIFVRDANDLRVEFAAGTSSAKLSYLEVPVGEGLTGWVSLHRQTVVNGSPAVDPGFPPDAARLLKSALSTSLEGSQKPVGVLNLYRREKDAFDSDELHILNTVTPSIALALENAVKLKEARVQDKIDPRTGLASSSLFLQTTSGILARARRTTQSLCVLFVEVRALQGTLNKLGESRTNERIASLGKEINGLCREYDCVGQIGKASFAATLPAMKQSYLWSLLNRLESLAGEDGADDSVALSFGGAFYPEDGDGASHLLALAQRRARNTRSDWTESIRALAVSIDEQSPSKEKAKAKAASAE